jgi:multicomponent Na+:H+ antiporter subunit E
MRIVSLLVVLVVFWLALSGHYKPFLLAMGAVAALLSLAAALRMDVVDDEGHPIQVFRGTITYYPWLAWEIVKAAWGVTKVIVDPKLPITPTMTRVRAGQRTTTGRATYANSITLTPGTITTEVNGDIFTVHALVKEGADDLEGGGMDKRVTQFEGQP